MLLPALPGSGPEEDYAPLLGRRLGRAGVCLLETMGPAPTTEAADSKLSAEEYLRREIKSEARLIFGNLVDGDVRGAVGA